MRQGMGVFDPQERGFDWFHGITFYRKRADCSDRRLMAPTHRGFLRHRGG